MASTKNEILRQVTTRYLASLDPTRLPSPSVIEDELIEATNKELRIENAGRSAHLHKSADANERNQIPLLKTLEFSQIAEILTTLDHVVRIAPVGLEPDRENPLIGVYVAEGDDEGVYDTREISIRQTARLYHRELKVAEWREVLAVLQEEAPWARICADRNMVAVKNGIFDYRTKELRAFSPQVVFVSKLPIDFDPHAENPVLIGPDGEEWDVVSWIASLSDDDEIVELLWQVIGAVTRPFVSWNVAAFLYSEKGNNGKGTLLELMRHLVGPSGYASIQIHKFGKDFELEPLVSAQAVLTDENPVGKYTDDASDLKAVITHDQITINRKFKSPVSFQFWGFVVQCVNDFPRMKDRSESFYRRQRFIPMTKWFGDGERRYIKDEFVKRDDVLRYVLKHVLLDLPDYYELPEPDACVRLLADHKANNDPVREFWEEFHDQFEVDFLPVEFLHELYVAWAKRTNPDGTKMRSRLFMKEIDRLALEGDVWMREYDSRGDTKKYDKSVFVGQQEPLIAGYELWRWSRSGAPYPENGSETTATMMSKMRGLVRALAPSGGASDDEALS